MYTRASQADIAITTVLIPGRRVPALLSEVTVQAMKPGSVVVGLAIAQGGNYPLAGADRMIVEYGITLVSYTNPVSVVAADVSALYAHNASDFLKLVTDKDDGLDINRRDDIVAICLLSQTGQVVRAPAATSAAK